MSPQTSSRLDEILSRLSNAIGLSKHSIEESQRLFDEAWDEVINILNEFGLTRFVAADGYYLALQKRESPPKLDEAALEQAIRDSYPKREADTLWRSITNARVDPAKLEQAISRGKLPASILEGCLEPGKPVVARVRQPWTKEDAERAQIFGIKT